MGELNNYLMNTAETAANKERAQLRELANSRLLITGSTGLIGSQLVRVLLASNKLLLASNKLFGLGFKLVLPVRNPDKAKTLFGDNSAITYVQWQLGDSLAGAPACNYVVHAACGTSSSDFLNKPASTIKTIIDGAYETLEYARKANAKYVFLSTMEVYGEVTGEATEDNLGLLDSMVPRNSYPEAKKLVECLCASYYKQYELDAVAIRLAQTFGQGVKQDDGRVFADFGRHAVAGQDIVLLSAGTKHNAYLSVDDAVSAILYCLVNGQAGEAYNAANESTYCSIKEMAELVLSNFGAEGAQVRREFDPEREATFRKSSDLRLKTDKLQALGWTPKDSLVEMYNKMLAGWKAAE